MAARLGLMDHLHIVFEEQAILGHGHLDLLAGQHADEHLLLALFSSAHIVQKLPAAGARPGAKFGFRSTGIKNIRARTLLPDRAGPLKGEKGLRDVVDGDAKRRGQSPGRLGAACDGSGDTGREVVHRAGGQGGGTVAVPGDGGRRRRRAERLLETGENLPGNGLRAGMGAGAGHGDDVHARRCELAAKLPQKPQVFPGVVDPGQKQDFEKDRSVKTRPEIEQAPADGTQADGGMGTVEAPVLGFHQRIHGRQDDVGPRKRRPDVRIGQQARIGEHGHGDVGKKFLGSGDDLAAVGIEARFPQAAKGDGVGNGMAGRLPGGQFIQYAPGADVGFSLGGQGLGRACFAIQAVERADSGAEQVKAQRQTEATRADRAENIP